MTVAAQSLILAVSAHHRHPKDKELRIRPGMAMERMLAKLSTRRYPSGLEPVGAAVDATARSTSKSAMSRRFVAATETALAGLLAADLSGLDLVTFMVDGVRTKVPVGGESTENTTVVTVGSCAPCTRPASCWRCVNGCAARRSGWSAPTSGATPTGTFRPTSIRPQPQ